MSFGIVVLLCVLELASCQQSPQTPSAKKDKGTGACEVSDIKRQSHQNWKVISALCHRTTSTELVSPPPQASFAHSFLFVLCFLQMVESIRALSSPHKPHASCSPI